VRVPQQDRSLITRNRVLDAAIEVLLELGYANTTAVIVADRAGVSRGAMQYHYPTKNELMAAAVEHLAARIGDDLRKAAKRLPVDGQDRTSMVIDLLWAASSGPLPVLWMELNMAARTDAELHQSLEIVERRVTPAVRRQAFDLFGADPRDEQAVLWIDLSLAVLSGLNFPQGMGHAGRRDEAQLLEAWKSMAPAILAHQAVISGSA
jgi:AcrR family transcriptional regulator